MKRIFISLLLTLFAVPSYAQQWDQVNGSMQVKSGPTSPLVIIDQMNTSTNNKILSLRANGTEKCSVDVDGDLVCAGTFSLTGQLLAGDGTAGAPSYSFANDPDTGFYTAGSGLVALSSNNSFVLRLSANVDFSSTGQINFSSTSSPSGSPDVSLSRGAANRLDLASGDSLYLVSGPLYIGSGATSGGAAANIAGTIELTGSVQFGATNGSSDTVLSRPQANVLALGTGDAFNMGSTVGAATSTYKLVKKVTGIADNTATDVLTVTVPNANHAATISLRFTCSTGSTDAFESTRVADGMIVLTRTTGVTTVAATTTLEQVQIATVAAGATLLLSYGTTAMVGAAGASQTFTVTATTNDSGNVGSNQCVVLAELVNAEATGITIQ